MQVFKRMARITKGFQIGFLAIAAIAIPVVYQQSSNSFAAPFAIILEPVFPISLSFMSGRINEVYVCLSRDRASLRMM